MSQQPSVTSSAEPKAATGKKVLIIEDDVFIRDLYEMQAKKMGYQVITADNGEEGINKAKANPPDLLLTDLMLPKLDGISIVKMFKSDPTLSKTSCLIITNLEDATKEKEALAVGASAYILKIKNTPSKVVEMFKNYI
ncbi:MAG: hypothetical protein A3D24_01520 [Candidatus Blackburnbacteria bacterium RIFCSPHIGHO2_02_FULL_39_13]|uniref:Response regulatory domain-containing protein n=1 Tax=Candidatus Blackburnbacteria bacterium RIFCSPLOWO2_01_FULL_40_20 TaxID=1797519 RepID=A0A1G1VCV5_9BACT|nr:MAG: hypothetical protein A2694_02595 [Candidatus Blackburnbacteria bacterium RIFCSPHIGHO2_01_FULL_40_17]OGY08729.1 MAG: hypothetical protein A3D24_01520 [Candidatus Blackburnbacteria bacterium RIFCSPHIGHO2_02_FULL_39_13]OGY13244.1 MAG: hypothetical protein A3A77_01545 [Candidatus Blackburnbacteria bacterium RIFCSPLOWO2_01_FULL_40_20]